MTETDAIRVTKKFSFDMAHALEGHDGPCKHIHGHTYHLSVTLLGRVMNEAGNPKNGMVIDFTDFKHVVETNVIRVFDHALVLAQTSHYVQQLSGAEENQNLLLTDYQPSCENLVLDIKNRIEPHLPSTISLVSVRLDETPTSYAEWMRNDNLFE